jgi:hypothetical protein
MLNLDGTSIYASEKNGSDEHGDGSAEKPFKTPLQVFHCIKYSTCFIIISSY